jgi:serine/threonine-protein kinase
VRLLGRPLEVTLSESGWLKQQLPPEDTEFLRRARIELLVPVAVSGENREALLVLGSKRSEEPYSGEDKDLLVSIAASLLLLLERPPPPPVVPKDMFEECPQCGACYDTGAGRCLQDGADLGWVRLPRLLAGRYRLERRLGRGGMGTVYAATDTALERAVAVKLIREDLTGNVEAAERFRREARLAASFTHPNVVTVHDFGVAAGTHAFLVMELLEGLSLREALRDHGPMASRRVVEIVGGVAAAVEAAHRRQLIHRDLKPENILLARTEAGEVPKVLDFGIAKALPTSTQTTADTGSGLLLGTPHYMAPEQLSGGPASPSWDVWALAVVSYELLTGVHPFLGDAPAAWQAAVLAGRFGPVRSRLPQAPAAWQQFFERALALEPHRRPPSARVFCAELERALS